MESLPVTLIVKAPNQQIEDQKIQCELSWTINKLKQHLSEVYPNKPPQHEQKLIYSGQLLCDSLVLKDILRQYEGQDTHTVHLVCTSNYTGMSTPKQVPVNSSTTEHQCNDRANNMASGANSTSNNISPESTASSDMRDNRVPNLPWMNLNAQQIPQMDLTQYQMQLAWMQQAYMQYMTQYMQVVSGNIPAAIPVPPTQTVPDINPNPNEGLNQAEQPQQPPVGVPRVPAAMAEDNHDRDWLDIFYMLSRAMVLFSVVYFYSSPLRFVAVLFLGISLYLYQVGFFRNINNNNNNINGPPNPAPQEEQAPTRFTVAWTFFTTFFASLIPEIPNAM
ncbi:homocysteine-responsive endoplasmic reticulum-resident ubiquitin-like domain member 2 protein [Cylas formicarius]|uniref:homocysteine-responsive endoplasmic reticulum-resident ubiquitin-like domain member 2 protein n=1 Tax=Cylas formicarius TaxID=197179 RepID=UPI0029589D90|nr:homocysteine-responsive endoplasmic reticulum-resident ubiquitin-like domain member 2 protein [Cylas formicarius]